MNTQKLGRYVQNNEKSYKNRATYAGSKRYRSVVALATLACSLASPDTMAAGNLVNHSSGITHGQSSNHLALFSGIDNPALGDLMVPEDENFRFSYFFSVANASEIGQVDNFVDDINDLIDLLEDPSSSTDPVDETLDRFNQVIIEAGEEGYAKTTLGAYLPPFPMYWRPEFLPGTLSFEINIESQINASILPDELIYDEQKGTFITATSAYLKSGLQKKISAAYSQELAVGFAEKNNARLLVGAKLNIYDLELSKQVFQLQLLGGKDIEDVVKDEYKNNRLKSTSIGLDFGAAWIAERYRLGASLTSLNAPSFDYGAVGVNCDQYEEGTDQRSNCEIAKYYADELGYIDKYETHQKAPVITVDGSFYVFPSWSVSANADLASYDDTVGQEEQWTGISTNYTPENIWVPGLRASYRKNLAGSKLDYLNFGLTFGGVVNLDFSMSLKDAIVDDEKAPRGVGFALSFEERF